MSEPGAHIEGGLIASAARRTPELKAVEQVAGQAKPGYLGTTKCPVATLLAERRADYVKSMEGQWPKPPQTRPSIADTLDALERNVDEAMRRGKADPREIAESTRSQSEGTTRAASPLLQRFDTFCKRGQEALTDYQLETRKGDEANKSMANACYVAGIANYAAALSLLPKKDARDK